MKFINEYGVVVEIVEQEKEYILYKMIHTDGVETFKYGKFEDIKKMLDFNGYKNIA